MKAYVLGWHIGEFGLCVDHIPNDLSWIEKARRASDNLPVMMVGHKVGGRGRPDRLEFSAKSARSLRRLVPRLRRIGSMSMTLVKGDGPVVAKLPLRA